MTYTTKRKLKFGIGMGFIIVAVALCLMPIFNTNHSSDLAIDNNIMIACSIVACIILSIVSQVAFGYVPPDPKDALNFALGAVERTREELVEIRLKQIDTEMKLRGDKKRSNWFKRFEKCRQSLQGLSITEIVIQIRENTPTYL